MALYYRYGTIYREVMRLPKLELCAGIKIGNFHPLAAFPINIVKEMDKDLVHECPYTEILIRDKIVNIKSVPSIFAQGHYRSEFNFTSQKNEKICNLENLFYWHSSEKNSFG